MILSTHALVGASVVAVVTRDPVMAFGVGMLSHYLSDMIQHWDYDLESKRNDDPSQPLKVTLDFKSPDFIFDLAKVGFDLFFGLLVTYFIFISLLELSPLIVILGAVGGVLPDFLQLAYMKFRCEPFLAIQKMHNFFHFDRKRPKPEPLKGILWQLGLVLLAVSSAVTFLIIN